MADFNSNSPAIRGQEWRPSSSRDLLLDASTKGVAMRFRGTAATYSHLHRFLSAVNGSPGLGIEILSQLVPDGAATDRFRPNEDVAVGSWTTQAGGTTNLFQTIDEVTLDTADYVKTGPPSNYDFRIGVGVGNLTGKRITRLDMWTDAQRIAINSQNHQGLLIGGSPYLTSFFVGTTPSVILTTWAANPSTGKPWTISEVETFDTTNAFRYMGGYTGVAEQVRVFMVHMAVQSVTENRLGFLYTTGAPTLGWFEENISDAVLSANTYYYVHVFPLAGNASNWFKVPLLKDPNVVMALNAAASTGEHRVAYSTTLDSGNGIITSATELPGEMIPMLLDVSGTIQTQSQPFCELD